MFFKDPKSMDNQSEPAVYYRMEQPEKSCSAALREAEKRAGKCPFIQNLKF